MSRPRESYVYEGELFFGEPKLKTWNSVCEGNVIVSLSGGTLSAFQGEEKVWEYKVETSLKCRAKDAFVQWQVKGPDGPLSYGLRLKTPEAAQKFLDALTAALAEVQNKAANEVVLRVILPGKETTSISASKSMTMSQLLKLITQRRHLDPLQYTLALPPDSPHGLGVPCQPQSTVGALKGAEVHVVRRPSQLPNTGVPEGVNQPSTATSVSARGGETKKSQMADGAVGGRPLQAEGTSGLGSEQTIMLHVELPMGDKMAIRVNANELLPEVLKCLCEMRDMNPDDYTFDFPPTLNTAGKTLQQLATNRVKIVPRTTGRDGRKGSFDSPVLGPKSGPPPPPPVANSKKAPPAPPEQQDAVGHRGRSGSLDSPHLSRKGTAAPAAPKGSSKVQPDLVKELSLKLKKGNIASASVTKEPDAEVEPPLDDDLEVDGDPSGLTKSLNHPRLTTSGKGLSGSVSMDGLSDRIPKKAAKGTEQDSLDTPDGTTAGPSGPEDDEDNASAGGLQRQVRSIKKKPVKLPEDVKQQAKSQDVRQPGNRTKQDVSQGRAGDSSKQQANLGQSGSTSTQEVIAEQVCDPPKQQANLGQADGLEPSKQAIKGAAVAPAKQPWRQESFKQGGNNPADVKSMGQPSEPEPSAGKQQTNASDTPLDGTGTAGDKYSSLKRKPRTVAPPPPVDKASPALAASLPHSNMNAQVDQKKTPSAATVEQPKPTNESNMAATQPSSQQKPAGSSSSSSTTTTTSSSSSSAPGVDKAAHRVPVRPAPTRPAPARPAPAPPKQQQNAPKQPVVITPPSATTVSSSVSGATPGSDKASTGPTAQPPATNALEVPSASSPHSPRRGGALVSTYSREDGGKVLVVRQSPVLGRRGSLPEAVVFNFPPPPSSSLKEDGKPAASGATKGKAFVSPSKSDTSGDELLLSPTKTDTSVEITNLDDVLSSSADESDVKLVADDLEVNKQTSQDLDLTDGSGTMVKDAEDELPDSPMVPVPDVLPPSELEDMSGPVADGPLSLPPPPSEFELMPPEPVFDGSFTDDDDDQSVDGQSGGIVLISVKPNALVEDIPPPEIPSADGVPQSDNEAELLPPPALHDSETFHTPSLPQTQPVVLAPPPSIFGASANNVPHPPQLPLSVTNPATLLSKALGTSSLATPSSSSSVPPPPPIPPAAKVSSARAASLSCPTPSNGVSNSQSSANSSPALGKASTAVAMKVATSSGSSSIAPVPPPPPPPPLPLSSIRYPAHSGYPTPPPLRAFDATALSNEGHFDYVPGSTPLDSPALVPPPIDSPLDSPGLYPTGSLTLIEPPSLPDSWQSEVLQPQPDHFPPPSSPTPPPPDTSPPHSPALNGIPQPPPPPPMFGSKAPAPTVKPKPPAAMRLKQMGGTFSEGEDHTHAEDKSVLHKHPLSVKAKAPAVTKWKSLDEEGGQAELLSKLQERKAKLKEPALPPTSGAQGVVAPPGMGDSSMQVQLQLLQQQMLQQQMMHLQQQFQQLQMANMGYGVQPMAGMNLGLYHPAPAVGGANPALLPMPMGAQPGGVPFPVGYVPHSGGVGPAGTAAVPPIAPIPFGMPPFGMVGIPSQPTVVGSASMLGAVPGYPIATPAAAQQVPPVAPSESPAARRMSRDELARSEKLGKLEEKFDNLMSEVREADPSQVLKKAPIPEEKKEKDSGSPYTGMAAALADALKQRRKHLTEKVGLSHEHDGQEWESSP